MGIVSERRQHGECGECDLRSASGRGAREAEPRVHRHHRRATSGGGSLGRADGGGPSGDGHGAGEPSRRWVAGAV